MKIANKISALSDTDYVKLDKLKLESTKQGVKDGKNGGLNQQIEMLKKEHAVKGQKDKYKQCLTAEKDLEDAEKKSLEKQRDIFKKWSNSSAKKDADKWDQEFYN